ncbi:peroxisomal biogenesis factor 2 [Obba rivulosa]|uniref:RING-type E3 ubiquitin transferase (cysteine targeting) n=1 Tax=Obba rivulosa TaxID=1052685 RepID=A0A8E2AYR5_9APHY|nr:peroxisomal biogenesis factor 2 [Obba rivulosa]
MQEPLPSASSSSWERAWDHAQPRLAQIRHSLQSATHPESRILRVGQLDAELLDQEIVHLLSEPLVKALGQVNSSFKSRFEPELTLFIRLTLYKLSVWNTGASYGAKLQGLRYLIPEASGLRHRTLLLHGAISTVMPYLHTRIRGHALSNAWPDRPSSDRRRKAWEFLAKVESLHGLLSLLSFVAFLWNGRYRTLADRLFGLRLVSTRVRSRREVSYEFMNRQMVWHAFTEFLLFLLPLIDTRSLRRRLSGFISRLTLSSILPAPVRSFAGMSDKEGSSEASQTRRGRFWALPANACAICAENASTSLDLSNSANALASLSTAASYPSSDPATTVDPTDEGAELPSHPINIPYVTSCGHVYCYFCISECMMRTADEHSGVGPGGVQWECLRCCEGVSDADRLEAQAEGYESGSEGMDSADLDSFDYGSEDLDFTDMSGSIGSYSELGHSD